MTRLVKHPPALMLRVSVAVLSLFVGCNSSGPGAAVPVPAGTTSAVDWHRLSESVAPQFTLTDSVPRTKEPMLQEIRGADSSPTATVNRECDELPAATAAKNWESVVDLGSANGPAPAKETTLNSLIVDQCRFWRGASSLFTKAASPPPGKIDPLVRLVRFNSATWTKSGETTVPAIERIWDALDDGRLVLTQPQTYNGRWQKRVDLWDVSNGQRVLGWEPYSQHTGWGAIVAGAAIVNESTVVTCSAAGELVWWRMPDGQALRRIWHVASGGLMLTPGRKFVGAFNGQTFAFYDANTGAERGLLEEGQQHFLSLQSAEFKPARAADESDNASAASGGDELLAWTEYGSRLNILIRWSLRDGRMLNFMPVPGPVRDVCGVRWLTPSLALIGNWVADLNGNRFVGTILDRPPHIANMLRGGDGRLWGFTNLRRLVPLDPTGSDFLISSDEPVAPLPLGPFAKIKFEGSLPARPSGTESFESKLIAAIVPELKSWGTTIAPDAAATIKLELTFQATGNQGTLATYNKRDASIRNPKPTGSVAVPEYLLTGSLQVKSDTGHVCGEIRQKVSSLHLDLENYPIRTTDQLQHDLQAMVWNGWIQSLDSWQLRLWNLETIEHDSQTGEEALKAGNIGMDRLMFAGWSMHQASWVEHPSIFWKKPQSKALPVLAPQWVYSGSFAAPAVAQAGQPAANQATQPAPSGTTASGTTTAAVNSANSPPVRSNSPPPKDPQFTVPRYSPVGSLSVEGVKSLVMPPPPRIHFATFTRAGAFQTWDPRSLKIHRSGKHDEGIESVAFGNSGNLLVYATTDRKLRLYDLNAREHAGKLSIDEKYVKLIGNAAGSALAAGSDEGRVVAYRVTTRDVDSPRPLCKCDGRVTGFAFVGKDESLLAVAATDGLCQLVNFKSGKVVKTLDPKAGGLLDVACSPDGNLLAVATFRDGAHLFDLDTNEVVKKIDSGRPIYAVRFSKDGKQLWTGGDNARLLAWKIADGQAESWASGLLGHVREIHLSDDGLGLAAVTQEGAVKFWNLADPPKNATAGNRLFP